MENNNPVSKAKTGKSSEKNFLLRKRTASFSRWLHNYLSLFSFLIVLFFAITGVTLNHADWFDGAEKEAKISGNVPVAWVNSKDTSQIKKLEIVETLRREYHIRGFVSDFLIEQDQCSVSFKGPGYSADAFINRENGSFTLSEFRLGLIAVMNDLHKGRDTGKSWSWIIDISAIFLALISLSGLVMLFFLKKKRAAGLVLLFVGGALCYLVYLICVD